MLQHHPSSYSVGGMVSSKMADRNYLGVDMRGWSDAMKALAEDALPKAAKEMVNTAAFRAQAAMPAALSEGLDRPNPFTTKAFLVRPAKENKDLSRIESALYARQIQGSYLRYVILGGDRRGADYGAWPKDIPMVPEDHQDKYGNRPKNLLKRIQQAMKEEKILRGGGFIRLLRQGKFEGYFFGRIGGVLGYYHRPARKILSGPKKKGVRRSENMGPPDLMIAAEQHAHHKPLFREQYDRVIADAQRFAVAEWPRILAEKMSRVLEKKSRKFSTLKKPDFLK